MSEKLLQCPKCQNDSQRNGRRGDGVPMLKCRKCRHQFRADGKVHAKGRATATQRILLGEYTRSEALAPIRTEERLIAGQRVQVQILPPGVAYGAQYPPDCYRIARPVYMRGGSNE